MGVGSETDDTEVPEQTVVPDGDTKRRTSSRKTIAKSKPPNTQTKIPKKPAATKDKPIAKPKPPTTQTKIPKKPTKVKVVRTKTNLKTLMVPYQKWRPRIDGRVFGVRAMYFIFRYRCNCL